MRRLGERRSGPEQEVDISPLIDVVFILLIFFMVSTTFVKDAAIDIERPGAQSATPANTQAVRVSVDRAGTITMENVPVRSWMVQARVRDLLASTGGDSVLVVVDRRVPSETLIDVVDQCRLAGAADVGVVTNLEVGEG